MSVVYRFDRFELDASLFELRRDGRPLNVQAKVLDLIFYLVQNRGRLIPRAEILGNVWSGVFVGAASVSHAIMEARKALADPADDPRAIVTVRGRGYRFIAAVTETDRPLAAVPAPSGAGTDGVEVARHVSPARGIRWGRIARKRPERRVASRCASARVWR